MLDFFKRAVRLQRANCPLGAEIAGRAGKRASGEAEEDWGN
jgi:hypothetical protein